MSFRKPTQAVPSTLFYSSYVILVVTILAGFSARVVVATESTSNGVSETHETTESNAPNPAKIRLRSVRGITQKFPLFFGPPATDEINNQPPEAVVVILMSPGCPVVNQYVEHLSALHEKYNYEDRNIVRSRNFLIKQESDGTIDANFSYPGDRVRFLGVHPIPDVNLKDIARHAVEKHIPFRVVHDPQQGFIKQFGEVVDGRKQVILGQALVFDGDMNLVYSGAINDQFAPGTRGSESTVDFLERAIESALNDEVLELSPWETALSEPQGCVCRLKNATPVSRVNVNYYEHIQPVLLEKKCHHCHRPKAVGSNYELLSYDDVVSLADMIEQVISDRQMPPWPGHSPRTFKDESTYVMTDEEIALFRSWIRNDMPEGNPAEGQVVETLPEPGTWSMAEPDFVFQMARPYTIPASGRVDYVYYPVEMNLPELAQNHPDPEKRALLQHLMQKFPEGLYIEEVEVIPGAPPVVHHIQVHEHLGPVDEETAGEPLNFVEQVLTYGFSVTTKLVGAFTPGNNDNYRRYSKDGVTHGMHIQPNANLLFELHYTPNGTAMDDQSKVGIRFAREKPEVMVHSTFPFRRRGDFNVPPNQPNFTLQDIYDFDTRKPIRIERIRPHLHIRGKSFLLRVLRADEYRAIVHDLEQQGKTEEAIITDPELHGMKGFSAETLLIIPNWDFEWQRTYRFEEPVILFPGDVLVATGYWDNTRLNNGISDYDKNIPWGQQSEQEMFNTLFIFTELDESDPDVVEERRKLNRRNDTARK